MTFHFYSPIAFEEWDHRSPDSPGIGGSETAVVELAWRLARRGHDVTVYGKIPADCPPVDRGAKWLPLDAVDWSQPGVWVLSRCPAALDNFEVDHPGQQTWLICQDVFYPPKLQAEGLTPERSANLDICLPLCTAQERYMIEVSPELAGKTRISSNGFKVDLADRLGPIARDPFKLVYTSSPDRGLPNLLRIFKRAREWEPRLKLSAAYGFDNIKKCKGKHWTRVRAECESLMDQPGVTWLGRLGQEALYREFASAGLWVYPTSFTETSCVSCMEAQALGAIPITNPLWALADNVGHGVAIPGEPNDPLVRARYVGEILRLTRDLDLQERIRAEMMPWARKRFDWERVVDQYERLAACSIKRPRLARPQDRSHPARPLASSIAWRALPHRPISTRSAARRESTSRAIRRIWAARGPSIRVTPHRVSSRQRTGHALARHLQRPSITGPASRQAQPITRSRPTTTSPRTLVTAASSGGSIRRSIPATSSATTRAGQGWNSASMSLGPRQYGAVTTPDGR